LPTTSHDAIITKTVKKAVVNLQTPIVSLGLWKIRHYSEYTQGTSANEAIHSRLSAIKPSNLSRQTLESQEIMLGIQFYLHNARYIIKI
jgi:hypothetical protein